MKLTSTEIPTTHYLIKEHDNSFFITTKDNAGIESTHEITIPTGTWSSDDLILFLQSFFDQGNTTDLRYLIIYINEQTGKLAFRFKTQTEINDANAAFGHALSFAYLNDLQYKLIPGTEDYNCVEDFNVDSNVLYVMGFDSSQTDIYISILDTFIFGRLTSYGYIGAKFIYAHTFNSYFFIAVDDFITNSKDQIIAFKRNNMIPENILGRIQIKNQAFSINVDNNTDNVFKERNYFGNVKIRKLGIKLVDKFGNNFTLNNSEISLAHELTQSYCSENQNIFNKSLFI